MNISPHSGSDLRIPAPEEIPGVVTSVRKAIIPLAGLGTRLFPASHAMKKEFFPVVGPDGIARALFHYNLLEIANAGIDNVCLIVQPGDEHIINNYLKGPNAEYLGKLQKYPQLSTEAQSMQIFSERINFVIQRTQEGYGHAVYQARDFVGDEACLLLLGDHLFRGDETSPSALLLKAWEKSGGLPMSAVNRISASQLKGYGTIAGKRKPDSPHIIEVSRIIEKPTVDEARALLQVDGLGPDEFLGWFGIHVLTPSIFNILEKMIGEGRRDNGEFQLTRAQVIQRDQEPYLAVEMTGCRRFDFGTPEDYVRSVSDFHAS